MRRFLIWSAVTLAAGLVLAGAGWWAYWHFHARFQPVTIQQDQAAIQRLLDEASWVSAGGGGEPLYMIAWRDDDVARRYEREEFPKLRAAGVEPRVIVFARPDREGLAQSTPAERATVAEIWLNRDWPLYERWIATAPGNWTAAGIPAADGDLARGAVVTAGRDFVSRLRELLRGSGLRDGHPLILWRDREGYLKACACSDARSWTFIRDDLGAPDHAEPQTAERDDDFGATPLPYPDLAEPLPPGGLDVQGAEPSGDDAAASAPSAAPPAAPATTRAPPRAQTQDDATFF